MKAEKNLKKILISQDFVLPKPPTNVSFNCWANLNSDYKKQKASPVPAGKQQNFQHILTSESWGWKSHQHFPKVETSESPSFSRKKAILDQKQEDETLIIQK
jgi:hypothetical protein